MGRKILLVVFGILSAFAAIIVFYPQWLPLLYNILNVSRSPHPADVIVVLGGGGGRRALHAAALYEMGYAPRLLLSGHIDGDVYYDLSLIEDDIAPEAIRINDRATTTYDEAGQVLEILLEMNVETALIVTDRFHTRRARATYRHVFAGEAIALTFVSPDDGIDGAWWESERRREIMLEYPKMLYYGVVYRILPH